MVLIVGLGTSLFRGPGSNPRHNISIYTERLFSMAKSHNISIYTERLFAMAKSHNISIFTERLFAMDKSHNMCRALVLMSSIYYVTTDCDVSRDIIY